MNEEHSDFGANAEMIYARARIPGNQILFCILSAKMHDSCINRSFVENRPLSWQDKIR